MTDDMLKARAELLANSCLCGGRGWYEASEGDKYCTCAAGDAVKKADAKVA